VLYRCIITLAAKKIGDSPIKLDMKSGPQTHLGAESQSWGTIELVPKSWKMAIIIPRRRGGTWEGVPVATFCSQWICRMRGGLVHHTIMIPAALSLPLLRVLAVGRAPTIFQNDWLCTSISNFFHSPIFLYQNLQFFPVFNSLVFDRESKLRWKLLKILLGRFPPNVNEVFPTFGVCCTDASLSRTPGHPRENGCLWESRDLEIQIRGSKTQIFDPKFK